MIKLLKRLFGKEDNPIPTGTKNKERGYISPSELKKDTVDIKAVPPFPKNNKHNLLIMDDDKSAASWVHYDLEILDTLSSKIRTNVTEFNKMERDLLKEITPEEKEMLLAFRKQDYNVQVVTGKNAGFEVKKALEKKDLIVHYAILDIILGATILHKGYHESIDGIDIGIEMLKQMPNVNIMFYTGCVLQEKSEEVARFKTATDRDIRNYAIVKDNQLTYRRINILRLLTSNTYREDVYKRW